MVGEHPAVDQAPFEWPGRGAVAQLEVAHEDLVDAARERRREAVGHGRHEVGIAGDDGALGCKRQDAVELCAVAVDVEVHDRHACELGQVRDPAQLRLADDMLAEVARRAAREDRVPLPGERRPEQPVVEPRDRTRADRQQRGPRDGARRVHAAPVLQMPQGPDRELL